MKREYCKTIFREIANRVKSKKIFPAKYAKQTAENKRF